MDTSQEQRVARVLAGDRQSWLATSFELVESKLHPPSARPGIVPRTVLVEKLLASQTTPFVCVVAPAGYSKTTLLASGPSARGAGSPGSRSTDATTTRSSG